MIIVVRKNAGKDKLEKLQGWLRACGVTPHVTVGERQTIVGCIGDVSQIDEGRLSAMTDVVASVKRIQEPYKAVNRQFQPQDTEVEIPVKGAPSLKIGGGSFQVIAGPCSVESEEQVLSIARAVKAAGATMLRGGAFKPRTSPYAFQGLGKEGLRILSLAKRETGLPIVTEIMDPRDLPLFEDVDVLQIGARNMQNYELLKEVGTQTKKPVLLKRSFSGTVKELLMSAEYVLAGGNPNVILCERGIRTYETATRNTIDVTVVPLLHRKSHLPVIVDPSHATGVASLVKPLSMAATVIGADGLIVEVHNDPPHALCDGAQSLTPESFAGLMEGVRNVRPFACR
jgi:3-deoxy-7-phosphoheptulonate synthase